MTQYHSLPEGHAESMGRDALRCAMDHVQCVMIAAGDPAATPTAECVYRLDRARTELFRHAINVEGPDGLLEDVVQQAPHLTRRVEQMQKDSPRLGRQIDALVRTMERRMIQQRPCGKGTRALSELANSMQRHCGRGVSLAFDTYCSDVGAGD